MCLRSTSKPGNSSNTKTGTACRTSLELTRSSSLSGIHSRGFCRLTTTSWCPSKPVASRNTPASPSSSGRSMPSQKKEKVCFPFFVISVIKILLIISLTFFYYKIIAYFLLSCKTNFIMFSITNKAIVTKYSPGQNIKLYPWCMTQ